MLMLMLELAAAWDTAETGTAQETPLPCILCSLPTCSTMRPVPASDLLSLCLPLPLCVIQVRQGGH